MRRKGSQGGQGMYSGSSQRTAQSNFQAQQETLHTLAADTGGKALLDNNDLALGIVQAQKDISSYYILGYYSTQHRYGWPLSPHQGADRQESEREARLPLGLLRVQGIQAVHVVRPGASTAGGADAGRSR